MSDHLIRGITADGWLRVSAVESTGICERMRNIHKTLPLATAALGRTLTAASMMGEQLKDEQGSLTIQIRGGGPLGAITAVSDCNGNVRGYLQNPAVELPLKPNGKLDVSGGVGTDGLLTVIKDIGAREPFSGKVELYSGEIAEDIAAYYALSEQLPSVCALGVLVDTDQSVKCAGGYLIQVLPGCPDGLVDILEYRVQEAGSVTSHLAAGESIDDLVQQIFDGMGLRILTSQEVGYVCQCSQERVERALISMPQSDREELAAKGENIQVTCQFCDKVYSFSPEEILALGNH